MDSLPTQFEPSKPNAAHPAALDEYKIDAPPPHLPFTYQTALLGPTKWVSTLDIDPPGVRAVVGSYDASIKLYDFGGMVHGKPFKSIEVGMPIIDLAWSITGDTFLMASGSAQARLYDRNGHMISEFNKGDMYIRDPRHTDGHTASLTGIKWSPTERNLFATSSADSTIRIWDIEQTRKQKHVVVYKYGSGARGIKAKEPVTVMAYSQDGDWIAGGCEDGSIRIWKSKGPYLLPPHENRKAHSDAIISIHFSLDGTSLLTRGKDHRVCQWDLRAFKSPLVTLEHETLAAQNAMYSPDDTQVVFASQEHMYVYDKALTEELARWPVEKPTCILWHTKHDQCFVGTHAGRTQALFNVDPTGRPQGVAMHLAHKAVAKVDDLQDLLLLRAEASAIHVPGTDHKAGIFQLTGKVSKRQYEKMRQDPRATQLPERPKILKVAVGGVVLSDVAKVHSLRDTDPREALLKYAAQAENDPYWIAPAYKKTQPDPTLAKSVIDEGEAERVLFDEERQKGVRRKF